MTSAAVVERASRGPLARRRLDMFPLRGPGAVFTEVQGRVPGDDTTPAELADLISSIANVGLLQPILVEETANGQDMPKRRLVAGERRLRALLWGAAHLRDNPNFDAAAAVVCPGPLSENDRRIWQIVENLARTDLQPGELAAALLLERCAVATAKLLRAGQPVPAEVMTLDDPVQRWATLERLRGNNTDAAASWSEVITRLGLQLSPRKARELVRAFAAMPAELSAEMDEAKISLHTRITFTRLRTGRAQALDDIWAAVKASGRPDLLPAALTHTAAALEEGTQDHAAGDIVAAAAAAQDAANTSRADTLRARARSAAPDERTIDSSRTDLPEVAPDLIDRALNGLRELVENLQAGAQLNRYAAGSLRLQIAELRPFMIQLET